MSLATIGIIAGGSALAQWGISALSAKKETEDFSDGFVGCIRALVINGVIADLVHEATKNPWGLYGVGVGCVGKCSKNPCKNGGDCREGYDHFTCDCRWTPFKVSNILFKTAFPA